MQFLLTICFLVCKYPHVTNIINDAPIVQTASNATKKDNERTEIQKVTYIPTRKRNNSNPLFEPLDTQAITLVNPNLFDKESKKLPRPSRTFNVTAQYDSSGRSNGSISSRDESVSSSPLAQKSVCDSPSIDTKSSEQWEEKNEGDSSGSKIDEHLQNLRDLRLDTDCNIYDDTNYVAGDNPSLKSPKVPEKSKCLLLDALMSYLNSAVNNVAILSLKALDFLLQSLNLDVRNETLR